MGSSSLVVVLFSHPVMSDSLWPHGLQHTRPPCPSPSPGVCPSSCSLHRWCHPAISSSDALFSFCLQSFLAWGIFPVSHLFTSDDQNTVTYASAWILPVNIQGWSPLRLTGLISLLSKGLSGVFSHTTVWRYQFFGVLPSLQSTSEWPLGRTIALTIWTFVSRILSLLFNTLSRFVIAFLPRSNQLLISWLQSPSTVILEPKKVKSVTVSIVSSSIYHEVMGPDAMIFVFLMLSFKPAFYSPLSPLPGGSLVPLCFLP